MPKSDEVILGHIKELVEEEDKLYNDKDLDDNGRKRLRDLQVQLDQCWDLLRQRRALREFGDNPDKAEVRDPKTVEDYEN